MTTLLDISEMQTGPEFDVRSEGELFAAAPSLAAAFEFACARFGGRTAISAGSQQITYAELQLAASRVATQLQALQLKADSLVAIYVDRSIDMVAAMLGVIRAGAAYLPIDPASPEARVLETLADASPIAIITDRERCPSVQSVHTSVFAIEDLLSSTVATQANTPPQRVAKLHDLAYVIYTSGSTGRPKGVMVTHHNVLRLFAQTQPWFHFDEHDVWTMFHSFAFDFSVWEIWGPLLTGGRLVIVPFAVSRSPQDFYNLLCAERVTVLNQTPTAFSMLIQAEPPSPAAPLALRLVILGGEALNLRSLLPWFSQHGDAMPQLINMYGITETTVHVTYRRILTADAEHETDSIIGEPIPDLTLRLLNDLLAPVSNGDIGEICIAGPGVAGGYLNRPELSAERFVEDLFSSNGARMYRSGDLARRRADGELVYLGRADRQVKINGFRIELGEIEAVLTSCPGVSQTCVTTHADSAAGTRLVAYIVPTGTFETLTLRRFAEMHLPPHMRPAFYVPLVCLPINANGKVDRGALPPPSVNTSEIHRGDWPDSTQKSNTASTVAGVWRNVLQTDTIGADENFFDVGGTSLLLLALRTQLQDKLERAIPVTWLFEHATITSFAAQLEREDSVAAQTSNVAQNRAAQQRSSFVRARSLRSVSR